MLGVREAGGVARGFQHKLVLENLQFFSGSIEPVGISYFLGLGCGLGGRGGLGGACKVVHDHFSVGQRLLELAVACHVIVALCSSLVALNTEAGDKLMGG